MNFKNYINELKRRNVIKASLAYLIVAWLIIQVASIVLPTFEAPPYVLKTILFILGIGFPILVVFSWVYDLTPEGIKKTKKIEKNPPENKRTSIRLNKVIIVALSLALILALFNPFQSSSNFVDPNKGEHLIALQEKSIAVLPFSNMSTDSDQDYFCYGIAEDILNDLTHIDDLRVVARATSFVFNKKNQDIKEIGKKLGVQLILEGSVQKEGDKIRIRSELVNVIDGTSLWSERYYRDLKDVFAIQNEIAQNIVRALKLKLSENEVLALGKIKDHDIQAYDFYIRGKYYFYIGQQDKVRLAIPLFEKAIEIDENYALAYSGLADSNSILYMFFDKDEIILENALKASKKAVELDSNLAEAHSARGFALSQNNQFEEAEEEFKKAINLNSNLYDAFYHYGRACRERGKHQQAAIMFEKAAEIEPDNYRPIAFLMASYLDLNRPEKAKEANLRAIVNFRKHVDLNPDDVRAWYLGSIALVHADKKEEAIIWIERALTFDSNDVSVLYNATCIYSLLGETDLALDYFEKAIKAGFASLKWIQNDSDLNNIREFPKFKLVLEQLK